MADNNDASRIRFAPDGELYVRFAGSSKTDLPTNTSDDPAEFGFVPLGYSDENGVTITPKIDTDAVNVWQSAVPVLYTVKSASFQIKSTLMEVNKETTELFFGSEWKPVKKSANGDVEYQLDIRSNPDLKEIALVVDWSQGSGDSQVRNRCVIGRAMISDRGGISLTRSKNQTYELTIDALDNGGLLGSVFTTDDMSSSPNVMVKGPNQVAAGAKAELVGYAWPKDDQVSGDADPAK
ncbi:hypothetical protein [Streptomyces sp. 769]|uniref:phage tail tube protein n=1 Tax=Streptomyces sp. 769 TaxID=1262452 RepID=UPI000581E337|nr:hypothetical protein [Streptomyces sp. 769]AJC53996.1 hypothetical protein GZL_01396 [Streptomyces sp. 769]